jgi:hypothetical protein
LRPISVIVTVPLVLALAACTPPAAEPSGSSPELTESVAASPSPTPVVIYPEDATMTVTATATASTGAQLDLTLVVRAPVPWNEAATAVTTTTDWCLGEQDASTIAAGNYSFTEVDYLTEQVGDLAWPAAEPIWLHPTPTYTSLAASGGVTQVAFPFPVGEGDYVPHCAQTAVLPGAGDGIVYLGARDSIGRDGLPPLQFWSRLTYGFNNSLDAESSRTIGFDDCKTTITALGAELGAPGAGWHEDFLADSCIVGGMTGY